MSKTKYVKTSSLLLGALLALPLAACSSEDTGGLDGIQPGDQTDELAADLVLLREEEKLARDVYRTLYAEWEIQVFQNISESEQRHMDAVGELLTAFEIPDPITSDTVGDFTSPVIAGLYEDLVAQGMQSEVDALLVGATIEDMDIFDIRAMRSRTDNALVMATYDKLECGSNNHLWAFTGQLDGRAVEYTAQYLSSDEIEAIVSSGHQSCGDGTGGGGGGGMH